MEVNVLIAGTSESLNEVFRGRLDEILHITTHTTHTNFQDVPALKPFIQQSDIILLDVGNTSRSAFDIIYEMKSICGHCEIIAMHYYNTIEFGEAIMEAGASAYIQIDTRKAIFQEIFRNFISNKTQRISA